MFKQSLALALSAIALTANAAVITSDENAGNPLATGSPYFFDELVLANTDFAYSVHFSTDANANQGSAAAVGLELDNVSSFIGDFTISLYQGKLFTGDDTSGATLVATTTGTNLNSINVTMNTDYSFVIEGLTGPTPNNAVAGSVAISAVPVPAAAWLFGSALLGFVCVKRKH